MRADRRWTPHLAPLSWEIQTGGCSLLRENGVYLIAGGLGGLGFELAKHLARNYGARLVLVSRKATETASDAFARELLTEVLCCAADVADAESMQSVVDSAERRFGRINGVFHCAGELQELK